MITSKSWVQMSEKSQYQSVTAEIIAKHIYQHIHFLKSGIISTVEKAKIIIVRNNDNSNTLISKSYWCLLYASISTLNPHKLKFTEK